MRYRYDLARSSEDRYDFTLCNMASTERGQTMLLAIDPGPLDSAYVLFDGTAVAEYGIPCNGVLLDCIRDRLAQRAGWLAVEGVACYGMPVGKETFDTCIWIGRYMQEFGAGRCSIVQRAEVKLHLCRSLRAKDPMIRQALLDRFGPGKERAVGTKKRPGPLYGVKSHCWSALAVACTHFDALSGRGRRGGEFATSNFG